MLLRYLVYVAWIPPLLRFSLYTPKITAKYAIPSGGSTVGPWPPESFLAPLLAPHYSRRVLNFEFRIYCLLKILANEKDVQGMNMMLL